MALTALFGACKDPMTEITEVNYPRAFSPVDVLVAPGTFDKATVTWASIEGALFYDVELSRGDSMIFNNVVQTWEDVEGTSLALTGLWGETQYSIRVKAKAFESGQQESKWQGVAFETSAEQILTAVKDAEVKGVTAAVHWALPDGTATKLSMVDANGVTSDIELTADVLAAGSYTLTGLTPDMEYAVGIYDGTQRRGLRTFTTQWKPVGGEADVVEVAPGADLATICADPANIGKIIYLPDGFTFTASVNPGIRFAGDMTLYGDPDAAVKPKIIHSAAGGGNRLFSWPNECTIDELKFVNLSLEGPAGNGNTVFAGRGGTEDRIERLGHIYLERCDLFQFGRCFIRIEGTTHNPIDKVTINNCTFSDIGAFDNVNGNYGFFTINVGKEDVIKEIVITNSSFRKVYHVFVNAANAANPCKSVLIENCTFNDFITGPGATSGRTFIDGNGSTALVVNIRNVILGESGPKSSGYRFGAGSSIAVQNTYTTSDYVNETAAQALPSVIAAGAASAALFADPANGDFTLMLPTFAGINTAGDPRWRP